MLQIKIDRCLRDEVDTLSELFEEMGALSVTLTDKYDSPILEPEIGTTPLWADVVIQALYDDELDLAPILANLAANYSHLVSSVERVPEQDWERVCMADFNPQKFGQRLWICPSWLTPPDPSAINLTLDPGLAFGTGTHPTTALCLTWLEQASLQDKSIIDYGCGSGVLALAALKLGANHVDAIDLDEQALIATRSNAIINKFSEIELTVSLPKDPHVPADILLANILLTPLINLQEEFNRLLKDGGKLVVSGILNDQVPQLIEAYQNKFILESSRSQGDWSLLVFERRLLEL